MKNFLKETDLVNFSNTKVQKLAKELAKNTNADIDIAKKCFLYVRGNKKGVDSQFNTPFEKLAFELPEILQDPLPEVIKALKNHTCYEEMIHNFPDVKEII